ncbi:MAG: hypothetical protein ACOZNI_16630 [Myxococcota bacterium]
MTDEELDARFRALGPVEPPEVLARATLAAVRRERMRPRLRLVYAGAVALAVAASALLFVRAEPERGDPATMVPRGAAGPNVRLDAMIRCGDKGMPVLMAVPPRPGQTLVLNVVADVPADVTIARDGVEIWRGPVDAGTTWVPKGWKFEPGEGVSRWTVSAGDASWEMLVPGTGDGTPCVERGHP